MKKLNLNIEVDEKQMDEEKDKVKFIILWIGNMVARAVNKPDLNGRATKMANMDEQRKYNNLISKLELHKNGIAELEDDDFNYMQRKFNQAEIPLNRDTSKLIISISKRMDEAKNG